MGRSVDGKTLFSEERAKIGGGGEEENKTERYAENMCVLLRAI